MLSYDFGERRRRLYIRFFIFIIIRVGNGDRGRDARLLIFFLYVFGVFFLLFVMIIDFGIKRILSMILKCWNKEIFYNDICKWVVVFMKFRKKKVKRKNVVICFYIIIFFFLEGIFRSRVGFVCVLGCVSFYRKGVSRFWFYV